MSGPARKSVEEYKRDVVQLKGMINALNEKQQSLLRRYQHLRGIVEGGVKEGQIHQAATMIVSATTIQRVWRGHKSRGEFVKKLLDLQTGRKSLQTIGSSGPRRNDYTKSPSIANRQLVAKLNREIEKQIGLDLAMVFRALDEEGVQSIPADRFYDFLQKIFKETSRVRESELKRLVNLLDESCSGHISKNEIHTCLSAYGVNFNGSTSYARTLQLEVLLNFAYRNSLKNFTAEDTFNIINTAHKKTLSEADIIDFCRKTLSYDISQKEADVLYTSFDIYQNGEINKNQFVKILEKALIAAKEQKDK